MIQQAKKVKERSILAAGMESRGKGSVPTTLPQYKRRKETPDE
jgi:hypothetical protein